MDTLWYKIQSCLNVKSNKNKQWEADFREVKWKKLHVYIPWIWYLNATYSTFKMCLIYLMYITAVLIFVVQNLGLKRQRSKAYRIQSQKLTSVLIFPFDSLLGRKGWDRIRRHLANCGCCLSWHLALADQFFKCAWLAKKCHPSDRT